MSAILLIAAAIMTPIKVSVPEHTQYCLSSNAIPGSDYSKPEIRNAVFDAISGKIEQAGLTAKALTIGVPYVDGVTRTPSATATATDADEPHASYVVRVCAVIPSALTSAFPADGTSPVPARDVMASLCQVTDLDECRRAVEGAVRATTGANNSSTVLLRTRQALSTDASPPSLAAALDDDTLIVLREEQQTRPPGAQTPAAAPKPGPPTDLAVVSGEPEN